MTIVGFVGLGAMGGPMVAHLIRAGHEVSVWGRTESRLQPAIALGAARADSPAALASASDVVIGCLLDTSAVEQVYLDAEGLAAGATSGQVFVEHGTIAPSGARDVARALAEMGASFIDAPVTGGPGGAEAGTLVAMAGGDERAIDSVRPLLDLYTDRVLRVGPSGTGLELKLVNQLLVSVHLLASAEAATLVERLGIDVGTAVAVLTSGWGGSTMLARSLPLSLAHDVEGRGATVGGLIEVQRLIAQLCAANGMDSVLLPPVQRSFSEAAVDHAGEDPAVLAMMYGGGERHS